MGWGIWRAVQVAQRQLILVAKVLQNLANDTLPGNKEAYMEQLNTFISSNKPLLERFYAKVVSGADKGKPAESNVPAKAKQESLATLHQYIANHMQAIEQALDGDQRGISDDLVRELKELVLLSSSSSSKSLGQSGSSLNRSSAIRDNSNNV